jgi:hypothetical protein
LLRGLPAKREASRARMVEGLVFPLQGQMDGHPRFQEEPLAVGQVVVVQASGRWGPCASLDLLRGWVAHLANLLSLPQVLPNLGDSYPVI